MTQTTSAASPFVLNMEVNKKEGGEYKKVGVALVPVFQLSDFGLNIASTGKDSDGLPKYDAPAIQLVQDAVTAYIKAIARNKLIPGTAVTKAGTNFASTVAELLESSGNSGAALALHREFITAFTAYLTTSGKNAGVQSLYSGLVKAKASIALSTEARRNGLATQLELFLESLNEADQAKFLNTVESLATLCESPADLDDSDL